MKIIFPTIFIGIIRDISLPFKALPKIKLSVSCSWVMEESIKVSRSLRIILIEDPSCL